VAHASVDETCY